MSPGGKWAIRALIFLAEIYLIDAAVSFFQGYREGRDEELTKTRNRSIHVER